jgi:hypothetical protein
VDGVARDRPRAPRIDATEAAELVRIGAGADQEPAAVT